MNCFNKLCISAAMLISCSGVSLAAQQSCVSPLVQSVFTPFIQTGIQKKINCVNSVMNINLANPTQAYKELLLIAGSVKPSNALFQQQITTSSGKFTTALNTSSAPTTSLAKANVNSMQSSINAAQTSKRLGKSTTSFENSFGRSTVSQSVKLGQITSQSQIASAGLAAASAGSGVPSYIARESVIDSLLNVVVTPTAVSCICTTTYCTCVPARLLQYSYKLAQMGQDVISARAVSQAWRGLSGDLKDAMSDVGNRVDTAISSSSQAKQEQDAKAYNDDEKDSFNVLDGNKVIERIVNQNKDLDNAIKSVEQKTKDKSGVFANAQRKLDSKGIAKLKRKVANQHDTKFPRNKDIQANTLFKISYSQHEADAAALFVDYITLNNVGLATKFNANTMADDITAKDLEAAVLDVETIASLPRYSLDMIHSERVVINGLADMLDIPHGIFGNNLSLIEAYYKLSGMETPSIWERLWTSIFRHKTVYDTRVAELMFFRSRMMTHIFEQEELNSAMYAAYINDSLKGKTQSVNEEIKRRE